MENPLELPVPDDPIEKVHALAKDIAYGAARKLWTSHLRVEKAEQEGIIADNGLNDGLRPKWGESQNQYSVHLLTAFGYLERSASTSYLNVGEAYYDVTQKAFALLEKPTASPRIFISYKRSESSALALLIESRIKLRDDAIGVFIDKELEPGDRWHGRLEKEVRQRPFFICLLGPKSLGSKYVRNEINWALDEAEKDATYTIIPICHNEYSMGAQLSPELEGNAEIISDLVEKLGIHNAVVVNPEGAEQYELAMIKLLNRLGYSNI